MNNQEKTKEFNEKMKELSAKMKDVTDTAIIMGMETKDTLSDKVEDAKSNLKATKEQWRISSEKGKSKISSELLKAQMNLNVAKENIQDRKEAHDKEKLSKYIDNELEYALQCVALSLLSVEEAKLAFLEAAEAQKEYDEKYGEENK